MRYQLENLTIEFTGKVKLNRDVIWFHRLKEIGV